MHVLIGVSGSRRRRHPSASPLRPTPWFAFWGILLQTFLQGSLLFVLRHASQFNSQYNSTRIIGNEDLAFSGFDSVFRFVKNDVFARNPQMSVRGTISHASKLCFKLISFVSPHRELTRSIFKDFLNIFCFSGRPRPARARTTSENGSQKSWSSREVPPGIFDPRLSVTSTYAWKWSMLG